MKCILCGREVKELDEFHNWDGGLVDIIAAWYGSRHDCTQFQICLCDECLDTLPTVGEVDVFTGEPL
jgi:hypothetical protein